MKPFTKISAVLFAAVAILHLIRLVTHFQVTVSGNEIPQWISIIGFLVAGVISGGLWKESKSIQ